MTRRGWFTVKCAKCTNTQDFPMPRDSYVCGDCIEQGSTPPPAPPDPPK